MTSFFMDKTFLADCMIKIAASIFCGLILGIERKSRNQTVGIRTLILISVSSTMLCILSSYISGYTNTDGQFISGDPTRIAAGAISGIGFLGGGAIMRQGLNIKGLTSAAIIWTAAALGLCIGGGLYIPSAVVLFCVVLLLILLEKVEYKLFPASRSKTLHLVFEDDKIDMVKVKKAIQDSGFRVADLNVSRVMIAHQTILHYSVKAPPEDDFGSLIEKLNTLGKLTEFSITD